MRIRPTLLRATALSACLTFSVIAKATPPDGGSLEEVRAYENRLRHFTLLGDALVIVSGHLSAELQFAPWVHHVFRMNPFCTFADPKSLFISTTPIDIRGREGYQLSCGAEIGYRIHSGERGANGFFIGPSVVLARVHSDNEVDSQNRQIGAADRYFAGGVVDGGVQGITENGLTVGGGVGVMALRSLDAESTLRPNVRFFIDVGYSFE